MTTTTPITDDSLARVLHAPLIGLASVVREARAATVGNRSDVVKQFVLRSAAAAAAIHASTLLQRSGLAIAQNSSIRTIERCEWAVGFAAGGSTIAVGAAAVHRAGSRPLLAAGFLFIPAIYSTLAMRERLVLLRACDPALYEAIGSVACGTLPLLCVPASVRALLAAPLVVPPLCARWLAEADASTDAAAQALPDMAAASALFGWQAISTLAHLEPHFEPALATTSPRHRSASSAEANVASEGATPAGAVADTAAGAEAGVAAGAAADVGFGMGARAFRAVGAAEDRAADSADAARQAEEARKAAAAAALVEESRAAQRAMEARSAVASAAAAASSSLLPHALLGDALDTAPPGEALGTALIGEQAGEAHGTRPAERPTERALERPPEHSAPSFREDSTLLELGAATAGARGEGLRGPAEAGSDAAGRSMPSPSAAAAAAAAAGRRLGHVLLLPVSLPMGLMPCTAELSRRMHAGLRRGAEMIASASVATGWLSDVDCACATSLAGPGASASASASAPAPAPAPAHHAHCECARRAPCSCADPAATL